MGLSQKLKATNNPKIVVSIGECASRVNVDLKQYYHWAEANGLSLIVLTTGSKDDAARYRKKLGLPITIAPNVDRKVLAVLNPAWVARVYLFSKDWRLLWIQTENPVAYSLFTDFTFRDAVASAKSGGKK